MHKDHIQCVIGVITSDTIMWGGQSYRKMNRQTIAITLLSTERLIKASASITILIPWHKV